MSRIALGTKGVAYVMANGSGLLKLGATTLTPEERARQLTASTSSPTPFYVVYSRDVQDVNEAEREMHQAFADRRVNDNREFFQISAFEACTALDRIADDSQIEQVNESLTPWAELFASFPDDTDGRELTDAEREQCRELEGDLAVSRNTQNGHGKNVDQRDLVLGRRSPDSVSSF